MNYDYHDFKYGYCDSSGNDLHCGLWHKEFLFYPRIFNKQLHWFKTVYWRTNYVEDNFEYKTQKQYLFDELRGKN